MGNINKKLNYWLYKEMVCNEFKTMISEYTIDLCEQDLERLVEWGTLTKIQDTSNITTVEEFENRKFSYQLSEYAVEI